MIPCPRIVAVLDGSTEALTTLPVARTLARAVGSPLEVVHLGARRAPLPEALLAFDLATEVGAGRVVDLPPDAEDVARAITGGACATLVLERGIAETGEGTLGPIARDVLAAGCCPAVLVHARRGIVPWEVRDVLLPHDGTPLTSSAIGPAVELTRLAKARLHVLHVAAPGAAPPPEPGSIAAPRYLDQPQHEWPEWAKEFLERIDTGPSTGAGIDPARLRLRVAPGEPGSEVVRYAAENAIDLIVVAWQGDLAGEHASVVKAVSRDALCPVLVLRTPT